MRYVIAAAALVLMAGCGEVNEDGAIDSTEVMCDEFAVHVKNGLPKGKRAEVARSLAEVRSNAAEPVAEASKMLSRTANGPDGAYQIAADTFAQACFDWGWEG